MLNGTASWQAWEGLVVPRYFSPGFVMLSYLVSYVGALTTLELINRRTAGRGLYNWYLLFGSSISMGGIAIWCMHYISNRAIVLGDGQAAMQISYSSGFTTLSFFVPILVLLAAFTTVGSEDQVSNVRVAIGGVLAGLAICGMHYLGQAGISNYTCIYSVGNVVGSAVVAAAASVVALWVFFILRASWTNSWWKRALCALILAGAVFGMHWLASVGTQYRLRQSGPSSPHNISRNSTVIVVIVLSIAACFILIVLATLAQRRMARSADGAQHIILASATFDQNGRLMVTPEGLLPSQKVTNSHDERSFDKVFGVSHPVFHWIFRATRNWSSISSILPGMRNHLYHGSTRNGSRSGRKSEDDPIDNKGESVGDYSIIFRELFCIAASNLAEQLNEPLENVGVLFDDIFSTGQTATFKSAARRSASEGSADLERDSVAPPILGRGQLLFLVRRANNREAERLAASGYRFTEIQNVVHIIAQSMQINCNDLQDRFSSMYEYSNEAHILNTGVHLALFAIRASIQDGFDVLVRKDARSQLPAMQLPIDDLNDWKISYLSQLDGWSVTACLKFLKAESGSSAILKRAQTFATQLHETLEELREEINDSLFDNALLIAKPVSAPCCGLSGDSKPAQATLIVFKMIVPIHCRIRGQKLEFTPLSFFRTQQHVHRNSPSHAFFARMIHKEFGAILNRNRLPTLVPEEQTKTSGLKFWDRSTHKKPRALLNVNSDNNSEINLMEMQKFGGIMVSQEVSVDVRDLGNGGPGSVIDDGLGGSQMEEMKLTRLGTTGGATKEVEDPETYVDKLLAVCIDARG
ncbi:related to MHYT domain signalling protein [Phialocephala subalpina]|uniref:Related to MHYT domain signalling protein n=1 Tax=Phialocephala subalpina TaxID=576137 RepID=A0A1L7XNV4_9HELO|nr:related to MHYT domain signalling protein [Phialocephala subalpina]